MEATTVKHCHLRNVMLIYIHRQLFCLSDKVKIALAIREGNQKIIHRKFQNKGKMKSIFARLMLQKKYILLILKVNIRFFRAKCGKESGWEKKTEK